MTYKMSAILLLGIMCLALSACPYMMDKEEAQRIANEWEEDRGWGNTEGLGVLGEPE